MAFLPQEVLISLLETNAIVIDSILDKIKEFQIHEINQNRKVYGEYHHLFPLLRKYPKDFYEYTRMTVETFDYILYKIQPYCNKQWCNFHTCPIEMEERLVVTLR